MFPTHWHLLVDLSPPERCSRGVTDMNDFLTIPRFLLLLLNIIFSFFSSDLYSTGFSIRKLGYEQTLPDRGDTCINLLADSFSAMPFVCCDADVSDTVTDLTLMEENGTFPITKRTSGAGIRTIYVWHVVVAKGRSYNCELLPDLSRTAIPRTSCGSTGLSTNATDTS